jgi:hypothetical protein
MERKQLETTAVTYPYLRGLLAIPLGLLPIMSGLANLEWGPFRSAWVLGVGAALMLGLYLSIDRYYARTYGRVTPRRTAMMVVGWNAAAVLGFVGGPILIDVLNLPLNGLAVSWASVALVYYAMVIGLKPHHMVIWGAVLALGLVPIWGDPSTSNSANAGLIIVGAAVVATGIFDHRVLVSMFESPAPNGVISNAGA